MRQLKGHMPRLRKFFEGGFASNQPDNGSNCADKGVIGNFRSLGACLKIQGLGSVVATHPHCGAVQVSRHYKHFSDTLLRTHIGLEEKE